MVQLFNSAGRILAFALMGIVGAVGLYPWVGAVLAVVVGLYLLGRYVQRRELQSLRKSRN